jgi:hypothetical protein
MTMIERYYNFIIRFGQHQELMVDTFTSSHIYQGIEINRRLRAANPGIVTWLWKESLHNSSNLPLYCNLVIVIVFLPLIFYAPIRPAFPFLFLFVQVPSFLLLVALGVVGLWKNCLPNGEQWDICSRAFVERCVNKNKNPKDIIASQILTYEKEQEFSWLLYQVSFFLLGLLLMLSQLLGGSDLPLGITNAGIGLFILVCLAGIYHFIFFFCPLRWMRKIQKTLDQAI